MKRVKQNGVISQSDLKHAKYKIIYAVMFCILCILVMITIIPSLWVMMSGFKSSQEIYSSPTTFFPKKFGIDTIGIVWNQLNIGTNIISTFLLGAGELVCMLIVCGLGGFVLSRLKPKGTTVIFALVVWTMMMPSCVRIVPLFMSIVDLPIIHISAINSYLPLFIISGANSFDIILFKNFFDSISISLIEAAKIDGASDSKIFTKIMIPLSVPVIAYTSIVTFNRTWSSYLMPMLVITNEKMQPVPTVIYRIMNSSQITMNAYMMALTIACIPPILVFIVFQKQILGGINVGGVKG